MLPWVTKPAYGPKRFFFYSLFESDQTGAPLAVRNRAGGSIDAYAAAVGRWLVTRDGFDFLAYYLSDFDYASHAHGPEGAEDVALARTDAAIQALLDAAGGVGRVPRALRGDPALRSRPDDGRPRGAARGCRSPRTPTASSSPRRIAPARSTCCPTRASTRRRSPARSTASRPSRRRCGSKATRRSRAATARSFASARTATAGRRAATRRSSTTRTRSIAPGRRSRIRTPASCSSPPRRAGSSSTSAAATTPAAAATARSSQGDSIVPVLTVGVDAPIERITDVTPAVLAHFTPCPRRLTGARWSSTSCARAASTTSACSPRWSASRASSSCRTSCARTPTTTLRCRSARSRRSRSRTWSRASAPSCSSAGGEKVLDVGTGSGYQAAVLAELAREVHSIERIPELARPRARGARRGGLRRPRARRTSPTARSACPPRRRSTAIAVAAAARQPPPPLLEQLARRRPARDPDRAAPPAISQGLRRRPRKAPAGFAAVPCRFVPLVAGG